MAGLKPDKPIWKETDKAEVEIVEWDDPVWTPALRFLTEDADPRPLAVLLRNGDVPPFEVLTCLGIMLDPPRGYIGHWLVVAKTDKNRRKLALKLGKEREIRDRYAELKKTMQAKAAEALIMQETGLKRSKLHEIFARDDYEIVRQTQIMLGYKVPPKSPSKRS